MQYATPGSCVDLEVLKFSEDTFSFQWSKVGSKRQIQPSSDPNVLTFDSVIEKDFGYYRCDVKEAGRVVLTIYRALYKNESNYESTSSVKHLSSGM